MKVRITAKFELSREFDVADDTTKELLLDEVRVKMKELQDKFSYAVTPPIERSSFEWMGTEVENDEVLIMKVNAPYEDEEVK